MPQRPRIAILLGAMGHPDIRYPNGTEVVPQIDLAIVSSSTRGSGRIRVLPWRAHPLADARARSIDFQDRP